MRISKNRTVLGLLIVVVITLCSLFSYLAYTTYKTYKQNQSTANLSSFIVHIESILDKIELERLNSAIYLVSGAQSEAQKLLKMRKDVDLSIDVLLMNIKESVFKQYTPQINKISIELEQVRGIVDQSDPDYQTILYEGYHQKVFGNFLKILQGVKNTFAPEKSKNYLSIYTDVTRLKENSVLENTIISYFLSSSKEMRNEDIKLWNQLIEMDILPQYAALNDQGFVSKVESLVDRDGYKRMLLKEREMIMYEASKGEYAVSLIGWLDQVGKKMDYFNQVQLDLRDQIQKIEEESKWLALWYAIGAFILMVLFVLLLVRFFRILHDRQIVEETVKDIERVLSQNQQRELQRLIDSGKMDHIYKFLIKTIKDANQTKDLFLASMSHEIRTPLNGILGFTQLLKETQVTEEQKEFIDTIEKSSEHLLVIVNDILDLSKIKAQKIELEEIEFDPISTFESAVESYAANAVENNIEFNTFFDPELPTKVIGDPTKISQVIVNLLSNAMKFTAKNGDVNVRIENLAENTDEVKVKFLVSDTGIGISKEQKKKIFEEFGQADVSTSRKYGGTGLGLSISGRLVELLGGKLYIDSVVDEGSTFYFILVMKKPADIAKRVVADMSGKTIGILDPHIEGKYFKNRNLQAYIAYTGAKVIHLTDEILLKAKQNNEKLPDVIFVDHKYRQRGDEIKQLIGVDTKIVVLSTGDQKRNLQRYGPLIDKILYKPVNFSKTLRALSDKDELQVAQEHVMFNDLHLLVAEDNMINQKLISSVLNRFGIKVTLANNGKEALDLCKDNQYDMIFMDIEMPVMGGMEATANILSYQKNNDKKHTPVIALTANALSGEKGKYLGAGMEGYLSKPIELDVLKTLLLAYFEEKVVEEE